MTSLRLPFGRPVAGRRERPVHRASSIVSRTRLAAALVLVLVSGAFYSLTVAKEFAVDPGAIDIRGVHYTDVALVRAALDLGGTAGTNIFRLPTVRMERAIASLPTVLSVRVSATLPDHLRVTIVERTPIFAWRVAGTAWLVDNSGTMFAPAADPPADAAGATLPSIVDLRSTDGPARPGDVLDAADLETARILGALTPALVGSGAPAVVLSVDDTDGWVLSVPGGWRAVFGRYSPVVHPVDDIPRQVQCLHALLSGHEAKVGTVLLPLGRDCGVFTNATPLPSTAPARSPGPAHSPGQGRSPAPRRSAAP